MPKSPEKRPSGKDQLKVCWTPHPSLEVHNEIVLWMVNNRVQEWQLYLQSNRQRIKETQSFRADYGASNLFFVYFFFFLVTDCHAECLYETKPCIIREKSREGSR